MGVLLRAGPAAILGFASTRARLPSPSGVALPRGFFNGSSFWEVVAVAAGGLCLWWRGLERTRTSPSRQDECRLGRCVLRLPFRTVVCRSRPKPLPPVALLLARRSAWGSDSAAQQGQDCLGLSESRPTCSPERLPRTRTWSRQQTDRGHGRAPGSGCPFPGARNPALPSCPHLLPRNSPGTPDWLLPPSPRLRPAPG